MNVVFGFCPVTDGFSSLPITKRVLRSLEWMTKTPTYLSVRNAEISLAASSMHGGGRRFRHGMVRRPDVLSVVLERLSPGPRRLQARRPQHLPNPLPLLHQRLLRIRLFCLLVGLLGFLEKMLVDIEKSHKIPNILTTAPFWRPPKNLPVLHPPSPPPLPPPPPQARRTSPSPKTRSASPPFLLNETPRKGSRRISRVSCTSSSLSYCVLSRHLYLPPPPLPPLLPRFHFPDSGLAPIDSAASCSRSLRVVWKLKESEFILSIHVPNFAEPFRISTCSLPPRTWVLNSLGVGAVGAGATSLMPVAATGPDYDPMSGVAKETSSMAPTLALLSSGAARWVFLCDSNFPPMPLPQLRRWLRWPHSLWLPPSDWPWTCKWGYCARQPDPSQHLIDNNASHYIPGTASSASSGFEEASRAGCAAGPPLSRCRNSHWPPLLPILIPASWLRLFPLSCRSSWP